MVIFSFWLVITQRWLIHDSGIIKTDFVDLTGRFPLPFRMSALN